jgi:hypothetical protein
MTMYVMTAVNLHVRSQGDLCMSSALLISASAPTPCMQPGIKHASISLVEMIYLDFEKLSEKEAATRLMHAKPSSWRAGNKGAVNATTRRCKVSPK